MREIAGRLASVIALINKTIGFFAATAATALIAYWAVYVLFYPNGVNRWWVLLAIPAFMILPTLAAIIVQLPLWLVIFILAGSIDVRAVRLQHKLIAFIDTHERLYGRRPSEEEIETLAKQINQSREWRAKVAMWVALCAQGAAMILAGAAGYNGAAQETAYARALAQPATPSPRDLFADMPLKGAKQPSWMAEMNKSAQGSIPEPSYRFCAKELGDPDDPFLGPRGQDCLNYYGAAAFKPSQKNGD